MNMGATILRAIHWRRQAEPDSAKRSVVQVPIGTKLMLSFLLIIVLTSAIFSVVGVRIIGDRVVSEAQERVRTDLNSVAASLVVPAEDVYRQVVRQGQQWIGRAYVVNHWHLTAYEPIRDFSQAVISMLYVGWLERKHIDIGKIREHFALISVTACSARAIESVQPQATRKDIEIATQPAERLSRIHGHEGSFSEVLVNILRHGVKYSRAGSKYGVQDILQEAQTATSLMLKGRIPLLPPRIKRLDSQISR